MVLARYLCSVQVLKFDEYFIKIVPNDPKSWSQIVELIRNGIPKRFFGSGARILSIGHFSGWKSKFFEVSSWHFKHPIKLNFLIWHTQRLYPDKKSILEKRQFKSCPFSCLYVQTGSNIKKNEILWLDLNHSSIQNLGQVARNCDFLQPQATHCRIGSKWDMTFILHSYETSSLIFSHFTHYRKGGGKGCAHDTCKVLMGSKMWENDKKLSVFRMSIWVLPPFRPPFVQW